jgi:hypothetical protein
LRQKREDDSASSGIPNSFSRDEFFTAQRNPFVAIKIFFSAIANSRYTFGETVIGHKTRPTISLPLSDDANLNR